MKLDSNGYAPSIVAPWSDDEAGHVRHEIYYGTANRRISKANGFWVSVSPTMHRLIHEKPNAGMDLFLKQYCQEIYERTHTRDEFIKLIGKSYLTTEENPYKWKYDGSHAGGAEKMWEIQNR